MLVYHSVSSFQCGQNIHPASCKVCFISAWSHGKTWENIALCLKFNIYMLCKCVYRIYIYICIYGYCVWISYLCINMYTYTCRYIISNTHTYLCIYCIYMSAWTSASAEDSPSQDVLVPSKSSLGVPLLQVGPISGACDLLHPKTVRIPKPHRLWVDVNHANTIQHTHTTDKQKNTSLFGPSQMWLKTMCFSTVFFHMISY